MHNEQLRFLKRQLQQARMDKCQLIILTHHAPTGLNSHMKPRTDMQKLLRYMEYTELKVLIKKYHGILKLWGFGHTHYSSRQIIGSTMIVSNQMGYVRLGHEDPNFDLKLVIDTSAPLQLCI